MRKLTEFAFEGRSFADALVLHRKYLTGEEGGKRLVVPVGFSLSGANLSGANLSEANLRWANLSEANLSGANLSEANLSEADLSGILSAFNCIGNMEQIRSMQIEHYTVVYDAVYLQIGCQRHKIEDAGKFGDAQARKFDGERAVGWWSKWKETIFKIIDMAPATPGKTEA